MMIVIGLVVLAVVVALLLIFARGNKEGEAANGNTPVSAQIPGADMFANLFSIETPSGELDDESDDDIEGFTDGPGAAPVPNHVTVTIPPLRTPSGYSMPPLPNSMPPLPNPSGSSMPPIYPWQNTAIHDTKSIPLVPVIPDTNTILIPGMLPRYVQLKGEDIQKYIHEFDDAQRIVQIIKESLQDHGSVFVAVSPRQYNSVAVLPMKSIKTRKGATIIKNALWRDFTRYNTYSAITGSTEDELVKVQNLLNKLGFSDVSNEPFLRIPFKVPASKENKFKADEDFTKNTMANILIPYKSKPSRMYIKELILVSYGFTLTRGPSVNQANLTPSRIQYPNLTPSRNQDGSFTPAILVAGSSYIGLDGQEVKKALELKYAGRNIQVVSQDDSVIMDYAPNRIRIYIDNDGKVVREPKEG